MLCFKCVRWFFHHCLVETSRWMDSNDITSTIKITKEITCQACASQKRKVQRSWPLTQGVGTDNSSGEEDCNTATFFRIILKFFIPKVR